MVFARSLLSAASLHPREGAHGGHGDHGDAHGGGDGSGGSSEGTVGGIALGSSAGVKDATASSSSNGGGKSFALGKDSPFKGRKAGGGTRVSVEVAVTASLNSKRIHRARYSGRLGTGAVILTARSARG
jgi:hypothetical protein